MTDFYILQLSEDPKDVGVFTQAEFEPKELNDNLIIYTDDWINKIKSDTVFDLTLRKSAKQTDFISDTALAIADSLCYSEKAIHVLKEFKLDTNKTARVNLHGNEPLTNYEFIRLQDSRLDYINWSQSNFAKTRAGYFEQALEISSLEDYINWTQSIAPNKILTTNLSLNIKNIEFDLFFIGLPINAIFVSNNLKQSLEENNISGIKFIPFDSFTRVRGIT